MRTINASQVLCQKGSPYNYLDSKNQAYKLFETRFNSINFTANTSTF